jgi:hypothetical protein
MSMPPSEIPAELAYEAARDRALRTAEALIRAEGQVRHLAAELEQVTAERDRYATEAGKAAAARSRRRVRDRARRARARCTRACSEAHTYTVGCALASSYPSMSQGVSDAAEDADPDGFTYAIGQAD